MIVDFAKTLLRLKTMLVNIENACYNPPRVTE